MKIVEKLLLSLLDLETVSQRVVLERLRVSHAAVAVAAVAAAAAAAVAAAAFFWMTPEFREHSERATAGASARELA